MMSSIWTFNGARNLLVELKRVLAYIAEQTIKGTERVLSTGIAGNDYIRCELIPDQYGNRERSLL